MKNRIRYDKKYFSKNIILNKLFSLNPKNTEMKLLPYEKRMGIEPDEKITYKLNKHGLRSDNYKKKHNGLHILFAGDSSVEGGSNSIDNIWTTILYNKIKESEKVSGYYSIGLSGLGIQTIVQQILIYIEEYGKPDYIFAMYPDFFRYFKWDKTAERWKFAISAETLDGHVLKRSDDTHSLIWQKLFNTEEVSEDEERSILINHILLLRIFESFCNIMNIKYIWSTWDQINEESLLKTELFNNIISVMNKEELEEYFKSHPDEPKIARDNFHHGIAYNKFWANKYYEKYKEINGKN